MHDSMTLTEYGQKYTGMPPAAGDLGRESRGRLHYYIVFDCVLSHDEKQGDFEGWHDSVQCIVPAHRLIRARRDFRNAYLRAFPSCTTRLISRSRAALSMRMGSLGPQKNLLSSTSSASMSTKWQQSMRGTSQGIWQGSLSAGHGWIATTEQWLTQPTLGFCSLQQAHWRLQWQANRFKCRFLTA